MGSPVPSNPLPRLRSNFSGIICRILRRDLTSYGTYTHQKDSSASWRVVIAIGWVWTAILGAGVWFFPETPRYVYRKGEAEEAKRTLMRVYGAPENHISIYTQMEELESKFREEQAVAHVGPIREAVDMFKAPRMTYRILLGVMLQMFQQLTGVNYFFRHCESSATAPSSSTS